MRWLWFVGPFVVAITALLVALRRTPEESRQREAVRKWLDELIGPLRIGKKTRSRRVRALHPTFRQIIDMVGGGARVSDVVLLPKVAYLTARAPSAGAGSQHVTVVARLAAPGPNLVCRPLPIYDGAPANNNGVRFGKDLAFMEAFVVEGQNPKAIGQWLTRELRAELLELPDVWLVVHGSSMALSLYGTVSADAIDELVAVADALFAEHGATLDESLFGAPAPTPSTKSKSAKTTSKQARAGRAGKGAKTPEVAPETLKAADAKLRLSSAAVDIGLYVVGLVALVFVLGHLGAHPAALFNSPDPVVTQAWQGGWTTKGVGALVAVECYLLGLLALQAYLTSRYGQTIGKALFGARIVNNDGKPVGFYRGVLLRQWIWALLPLIAAAARAKPFSARTLLEQVPSSSALGTAVAVVVLAVGSALLNSGRGVHDRVAGTQVVVSERYRLPWIQLGERPEPDPLMVNRLQILGALCVVTAGLSVAYLMGVSFWIF